MTKLLLTALAIFSPFVPQQQVYEDFDTFQTVQKFEEDFSYVYEKRVSISEKFDYLSYTSDYSGQIFYYYAFPLNYDIEILSSGSRDLIYSNSFYNFYNVNNLGIESPIDFILSNYTAIEAEMPFIAFTSVGMSQIIAHDKELLENDKSLYGSFFAFFTGFFPQAVVAEYNGIFTAIVVAFLLFLVFGFIFFLFRTIRRLMGFR